MKSRTWLSDFTFTFHFYALEKEMATHSSVLAWRIPGMGLHRVGHDWSDLAVACSLWRIFIINGCWILSKIFLHLLRWSYVMDENNVWYNFLSLLRLILWPNVIFLGECFMCRWKEFVFGCFGVIRSIYIYHLKLSSLICHLKSVFPKKKKSVFPCCFYQENLSIDRSGCQSLL